MRQGHEQWDFTLQLDSSSRHPLFLQIAYGVSEGIRSGRLRPGQKIPSSRKLAETLGVHRNTVLAAFQELEAEGWISTLAAKGTFVSHRIPDVQPRPFTPLQPLQAEALGFDLPPAMPRFEQLSHPASILRMDSGSPDIRLIPVDEIAKAYRRTLRIHGPSVLSYGDPRGHERLRKALAAMVSARRGFKVSEANILVTHGSQMGLDLITRALLRPGDVVAVEALGYRPAWEALRASGARLVPLPVDSDGLQVEKLAALAKATPIRALYLTPHHQYPTTATLDSGRRLALLALARSHRIAILEDDFDHEFHYEGRPVMPLASADAAGTVLYLGTLSKVLAPGLRLGFVVAPQVLIERMAEIRRHTDRQGDLAMECAVAQLLEDGMVQRHVRKCRQLYQNRRDALVEALSSHFGSEIRFDVPAGGMGLWIETCPEVDADVWAQRALEHGVAFNSGKRYAFSGKGLPHARLGFANLSEQEIEAAVKRMALAYSSLRSSG